MEMQSTYFGSYSHCREREQWLLLVLNSIQYKYALYYGTLERVLKYKYHCGRLYPIRYLNCQGYECSRSIISRDLPDL